MARLADFTTYNPNAMAVRLEDIADEEVDVVGFRLQNGAFGEYVFMDVVRKDGTMLTVLTGARAIVEALKKADEADAFPLPAKFVKFKRAWGIE